MKLSDLAVLHLHAMFCVVVKTHTQILHCIILQLGSAIPWLVEVVVTLADIVKYIEIVL